MPASQKYPSDMVLARWALAGIDADGNPCITLDEHVKLGRDMRDKVSAPDFNLHEWMQSGPASTASGSAHAASSSTGP